MSRHALDFTGQRFGDLEVVERAGSTPRGAALWRCICYRCGQECIIIGHKFHNARPPQDCGCRKKEQSADLSGQTFGALTVLERRGNYKSGDKLYLCRCAVCGKEKLIPKSTIKVCPKSCGCLHYEPERMKKMSLLGLEANQAEVGGISKADLHSARSQKATVVSKTGIRGVFPESGRPGQYRVSVRVAGECIVRTGFRSIEEATEARDQIKHELLVKYGLDEP